MNLDCAPALRGHRRRRKGLGAFPGARREIQGARKFLGGWQEEFTQEGFFQEDLSRKNSPWRFFPGEFIQEEFTLEDFSRRMGWHMEKG